MKKKLFVGYSILFFAIPLGLYLICYQIINYAYNFKTDTDAIYLWGDSQTNQGIDVLLLEEITGIKVYSASKDGAGVYDFLVFTETVPKNATIVMGFSKSMQLRPKDNDRNRSGLSLNGINTLYQENYTFYEIKNIVENNLLPKDLYDYQSVLFPADQKADKVLIQNILDGYKILFSEKSIYLDDKQQIFLTGINKLIKKNCKINLIEFPYHKDLNHLELNSPVKADLDKFKLEILTNLEGCVIDSFFFKEPRSYMYDMTHLNIEGAQRVTEYIGNSIKTKEQIFFSINGGVSE
jgi:hypothetical protein